MKLEIGDVVQVRRYVKKPMWAGKTGTVVSFDQRPYGKLVRVKFPEGEIRTFGDAQLTKGVGS